MAIYSYQCRNSVASQAEHAVERYADPPVLAGTPFTQRPAGKRLHAALRAGDRVLIAIADFASVKEAVTFMRQWDFYGVEIEFTDADTQPGWETFRGSVEKFMNAVREACAGPDADTVVVC